MKYVINACYGGYGINDEWLENNLKDVSTNDEYRTNEILIKAIENGENVNNDYSNLVVVDIPDNATDWRVDEYDGYESILAVVDGLFYDVEVDD